MRPACPSLPHPTAPMSWRDLEGARDEAELYLNCLRYAQQLWRENLPARALLAVDRALYCDVPAGHPVLAGHPLPYAAVRWMVATDCGETFTGNARVHYQHLADRVRGPRQAIKRWRAWAGWALARAARPELPGDPRHAVREPTTGEIRAGLEAEGLPGEAALWESVLEGP